MIGRRQDLRAGSEHYMPGRILRTSNEHRFPWTINAEKIPNEVFLQFRAAAKTVVHGGEVSPQINQAIFSRSNFFLKLFCRQSAEQLVKTLGNFSAGSFRFHAFAAQSELK